MRLARLDLIRFGRFTDRSVELPRAECDLHVLYGPNEAGKSTALTAIEDLLYGINDRSPYSFLHPYRAMRLGAVLENAEGRLEFRRRKGSGSTVLGPDDLPLPNGETDIARLLGNAERTFFATMFNLGHERLSDGGREILAAEGDVGRTLFSAGTGLSGLHGILKDLEQEADGIWGPRKAKNRRFHQAKERFDEARKSLNAHTLSVADYLQAEKAFENADENHRAIDGEHHTAAKELRKLERIRRVHAAIRRRNEVMEEITALGDVPKLPEDASEILAEAERSELKAQTRFGTLSTDLENTERELESLGYDRNLVQRADEIRELHELRIEIRNERNDLPKRRMELEEAERDLGRLANELGWDDPDADRLIRRIPDRPRLSAAREHLGQRGGQFAALRSARREREEAAAALAELEKQLEELGEAADTTALGAALAEIREEGGSEDHLRWRRERIEGNGRHIERLRRDMNPAVSDDVDLRDLRVPPRAIVQDHRDRSHGNEAGLREARRNLRDARRQLVLQRENAELQARDEGIEPPEEVDRLRTFRDDLWELVRVRYVDGTPITGEQERRYGRYLEALPESYGTAVRNADQAADRRFDKAEAAGRLAELARAIRDQEAVVRGHQAEERELEEEQLALGRAWRTLWEGLPIEPGSPEVMLIWLENREKIVTATEQQHRDTEEFRFLEERQRELRSRLVSELAALGEDGASLGERPMSVLGEFAGEIDRKHRDRARQAMEIREAARHARSRLAGKKRDLERAEADWSAWRTAWEAALSELGLPTAADVGAVAAQIGLIDGMREVAVRIGEIRDKRISTIERDIGDYVRKVRKAIAEFAPDLADTETDEAVLTIEERLEKAQDLHGRHKDRAETAASLRKRIEEIERERKEAWASVQPLKRAAGEDGICGLKSAIECSDRRRSLDRELAGICEMLRRDGDGLPTETLAEECRDTDIDGLMARQGALEDELRILGEKRDEAAELRFRARAELDRLDSNDGAARAAADQQEAVTSMSEAAAHYARLRTSAILLRWAIDRFRREKQGPLLKRAGELFRILTLGSFERLGIQFDNRDDMLLTGVRPTGEEVPVSGLSSGTEDQLFLALRMAAVEDYLGKAPALPFVADDLFINFDPDRSAAGFEILGRLAQRTQVLFLTHHAHLVDTARDMFGNDLHIESLGG